MVSSIQFLNVIVCNFISQCLAGRGGMDKFDKSVSALPNITSSSTCIQYDRGTNSFKYNAACGQATAICESPIGE